MNISISWSPVFNIEIDLKTLSSLMKLSGKHYDSKCRSVGKIGGFLYGWRNSIDPQTGTAQVTATFSDLDLTLKLCEIMDFQSDQSEAVDIYRLKVLEALKAANHLRPEEVKP